MSLQPLPSPTMDSMERKMIDELIAMSEQVGVRMDEQMVQTLLELLRLNVTPESLALVLKVATRVQRPPQQQAQTQALSSSTSSNSSSSAARS